jgi:hypothetical protein
MGKKFTYDYVKQYFQENRCELLSEDYIAIHQKLDYICSCGNQSSISFDNFKHGHRCFECSGSKKYDYEYIKDYFLNNNCELLEPIYINNRTSMKYKCSCGTISSIKFYNFKMGYRCNNCGLQKTSGKNHYKWKQNRDEIKLISRLRKRYTKIWIKNNMQHDPNYNEYLLNSKNFHIDHIIPIDAFCKILIEKELDEHKIKEILNNKRNIQLLTQKENTSKQSKHSQKDLINYIDKYYYDKCTI